MTKAIVFDLGGVLIDLKMQDCIRHFQEDMGFDRITEMIDPSHQKGIYKAIEAGTMTADEFRSAVLAESRPGCTPDMVDVCMHAFVPTMAPYKADLLKDLHEKYGLYLLSNNNPICMAHIYDVFSSYSIEHRSFFKGEIISYEVKVMKPSREIYEMLVKMTGCRPEEIMFIDDSAANVDAARALGINAVLYSLDKDLAATINGAL